MKLITLGHYDPEAEMPDWDRYFSSYHHPEMNTYSEKREFREEMVKGWAKLKRRDPDQESPEFTVRFIQEFLQKTGFGPFLKVDGVCGYRTFSSLRLFQEYVRSVEDEISVGFPDGLAGQKTFEAILNWKQADRKAAWVNRKISPQTPSQEYRDWIELLKRVKEDQLTQLKQEQAEQKISERTLIHSFGEATDTLPIDQWEFSSDHPQIIGIRRKEGVQRNKRENDDVFIVLVNGMVLKFFGTTDPHTRKGAGKTLGAPFLTRGQHKYHYGWHKVSDADRIYRALQPVSRYHKPEGKGVLIFRDKDDQGLLGEDINSDQLQPNKTINIHWGGIKREGTSNWSAGCQAICGLSYINPLDQLVNCEDFAARNYRELGQRKPVFRGILPVKVRQTFGAYSILVDMLTVFAPLNSTQVSYTLLYEEDLDLHPKFGKQYAQELNRRLRMLD